jgi:N6-L-threonylcarbamoyladenine synthase
MTSSGELVLGIETSCDDTAVALVTPGGQVISACVASQTELHNAYGGVYPELASRAHIEKIIPAVQIAMSEGAVTGRDLAAVAVTRGPGLIGSLIVGLNAACGLGQGGAFLSLGSTTFAGICAVQILRRHESVIRR